MNELELREMGGGTISGLLASRASWAPDNIALVFEGVDYTYAQFDQWATDVAQGLRGIGLQKGEAVGILLQNRPEYLWSLYGCNRCGGISVPINTAFKHEFLNFPLERAAVKVLITEAAFAEQILTIDSPALSLSVIVFLDSVPDKFEVQGIKAISWSDMLSSAEKDTVLASLSERDVVGITFTSGTTGRSKGVVTPNLQHVVMGREATEAFDLGPNDRIYACTPMFHGMAQVMVCVTAIYAGGTIILARSFSASRFWEEVRISKATMLSVLGSIIHILLSKPLSDQDSNHAVRRVFAAPGPPDVLYRFEQRFNVHVVEGMGLTEIKNVFYNPLIGRKVGSVGKPTPSSTIEIHDERGDILPPGAVGEIVYRPKIGNIMLKEYLGEADNTLEAMRGLWWHTGDMGWVDRDGFFWFFDRTSDRLRRRGENISSWEVEGAVAAYRNVSVCAAVAVHSPLGEDEVMVVFETAGPETFDYRGLTEHCLARLPKFMVPRYYRAVIDLPRTPNGKIRKVALREEGLTTETWDIDAYPT